MLVLRRKEGQWTEAHCRNGDLLRFRVQKIGQGTLEVVFDDPSRSFEFERPERRRDEENPRVAVLHDMTDEERERYRELWAEVHRRAGCGKVQVSCPGEQRITFRPATPGDDATSARPSVTPSTGRPDGSTSGPLS